MDSIKAPETPLSVWYAGCFWCDFDFSYADHTVGLNLEMDGGQDLADVELLVTDVAKGEGLSLVPVGKNGNLIQYQVVMNVPIPTFIQAETDTSVNIDPNYKITISGVSLIFLMNRSHG